MRLDSNQISIFQSRKTTNFLLLFLVLVVACFTLKTLKVVIAPFFIAIFVVMSIQPVMNKLERFFPRWLSLLIVLLVVAILLFATSILFFIGVKEVSAKTPFYVAKVKKMTTGLFVLLRKYDLHLTWEQLGTQKMISVGMGFLSSGLSSLLSLSGHTLLILFLILFLEMEMGVFQKKLRKSFALDTAEKIEETFRLVKQNIQSYLFAKTVVSVFTGVFTALITYFLGVDFFFFWGILAFLLNYIPNIGSAIGMLPPVFVALLQFDSPGRGIVTFFCLGLLQTVMGYIIDPRLTGGKLRLSPFAILLSIVFWGWLWGISGMVLAVPFLVVVKMTCYHIPDLRFVSIFLGENEQTKDEPSTASIG